MATGEHTKQLWADPVYRQHMSTVHLGHAAWNKGLKKRLNTGRTLFEKGHKSLGYSSPNDKNANWKGDKVGYHGLHSWLSRNFGKPTQCENCKTDGLTGRQIHWANITKVYNRERENWARLCVWCHNRFDKGCIQLCLE